MGSEHQKFKKGQRSISAEQMNAVSRDAEVAGKTKIKGGRQHKIVGVGQVIDTSISDKRDAATWDVSKTVVIKKSPSVNAGYVTVQAVRYSTWPIEPCDDGGCHIVAYGSEIEARPEYGQKADGYAAFEVGTEPITTGTAFFRVRRENDAWILNTQGGGGGGETDIALVHQAQNVGGNFVKVVHQKLNTAGTAWVTAERTTRLPGETVDPPGYSIVRCWPGTAEQFWRFLNSTQGTQPNFTAQATGVYVATVMINGVELIMPVFPINMFAPNPALPAGDC